MQLCCLSNRWLKRTILCGVAFIIVNLLAFRYWVDLDLDRVDLALLKGHTIIIDPGHGGIDCGAEYFQLKEKDINLEIALKLGKVLQEYGAQVFYTRSDDVDYYTKGKGGKRNDLLYRIDKINTLSADLFVSIHCNAAKEAQWYGAQVYYNPKDPTNKEFAETMQILLKKFPPNNKREAKHDTKLLLLKNTSKPGMLIETGFLSNQKEAKLLSDDAYQKKMVQQIAKGLAWYFRL